jgi:uncharacterized protein (TIGR00251 family)
MAGEAAAGDWYRWEGEDLLLSLRVQPRAKRDALGEPQGEQLKVRITAPPVEGKANAHLCRFLAEVFGVPTSRVELLAGAQARGKRLRIRGPTRLPAVISREQAG